ncbi:MAG TPA: phosphopantetheine-binding protein [Thermoanaerobaculia bacterium]|jgi:acyl carrier protein|nr:phosphopantetheine-binding protein [Thermoanaerobaculia bacterium]
MADSIVTELKRIIADDLDVNIRFDEIDETVPLLGEGLALDSVVVVELISLVEDRFGFEFEDSELNVESFRNLNALAGVIERRRAA